ncbi:MAG: outer membrane protein [Pseudoalteromonas rhizosphaerae]|jgi:outer membrane protein|uniref:TIGR04219 family outer membrane beta-barrel protein n=1 Tax=Pseudoalteromonas neustonica TaxID=1840331 RepID=A0ABY3FG67_9GAMM|nr:MULTISPECIES: TIGR04219 family outer membrane beta-barrel protein [Pseudoalteromonas]MBB1293858.1 TIGR04219 family outer membrane beta-barrel protein [Pseudoalteromonas sp. SR41-4]MBB1303706.1 TIGR04219 family outer membrane beta-barrel protein [Pseudoalteromonas sp. SR44-8]MBB1311601.1 TIGR04219 family outer membrane beta-barrel protein [Pseudoalteromonas sp. SR41-8]MBB1399476.1 TIGR04219 family outer membrane beta-barrel protein [Pseudoalteromonas sp. SG44-8]MBB1408550.1 TIGR04219 family |tara:strand:+ start:9664 stop:10425 length:762 start_codon:yes stop_codon:yes gene_type:complete|eukprot:GDKH01014404.1.p1 GENE.GDKH01014404.1~~GDKH01014404.1.p1  ORF type:complete len:254 (-),score=41.26 GDKH01014404.1:78-839(-)
MKKYCLAAALSMAFLAPAAHADTLLGLYVGVDGWQSDNSGSFSDSGNMQDFNFEDETFISYYAALEHPIPLVPNIKLKYTELELNGSTLLNETFEFGGTSFTTNTTATTISDLSHVDYILYYEIFDNDLLSIDLGVNAKQFDGDIVVTGTANGKATTETVDFSGFVPLVYGRAEVGLPLTGLSVFFEGSLLAIDDSKVQDYQAGIAWALLDNLAVDLDIKAGYRQMTLELDDIDNLYTNIDASGPFAGIQIHF